MILIRVVYFINYYRADYLLIAEDLKLHAWGIYIKFTAKNSLVTSAA